MDADKAFPADNRTQQLYKISERVDRENCQNKIPQSPGKCVCVAGAAPYIVYGTDVPLEYPPFVVFYTSIGHELFSNIHQ